MQLFHHVKKKKKEYLTQQHFHSAALLTVQTTLLNRVNIIWRVFSVIFLLPNIRLKKMTNLHPVEDFISPEQQNISKEKQIKT